ncbi:hypothetical protein PACTADRAFT_71460 [Pachysolen tannophilus NRRL Y-2460]|uniref:RWD domain-containing protein n=1 Tax=Pachysolen tannophilus NRRL Y-2460 TaxID=669874 RepID=A0A1E4TPH8_PACTA|nr:hypothetical protein PACTADRAFT_71460 [Pachysolen tannophilus NRRL Y-2460]
MQFPCQEFLDEIGAIEAIYPDSIKKLSSATYEFKVPQHDDVKIEMSFPKDYPRKPPSIERVTARETRPEKFENKVDKICEQVLNKVYVTDMVCVFDFLSFLENDLPSEPQKSAEIFTSDTDTNTGDAGDTAADVITGWVLSDAIIDRKSKFQAYAREVHSVAETTKLISDLKTDKKLLKAAHVMFAYRIRRGDLKYQDCDDDGESAAGGRLLHLLTVMDVWNCVVVVSRHFGGIHLGPDRFKHINAAARDAIVKAGINDSTNKDKKKK